VTSARSIDARGPDQPSWSGAARVIALGASAGGGRVLRDILRSLPAPYPHPVLVVHHLADGDSAVQAELLDAELGIDVREGRPGEPILPDCVYLAPSGYHMLVERERCLALSVDERVCCSRPSIDVLFESAAAAYREALVAVLLTGANRDGAAGLVRARESGALVVVQDPADAEYPAMPTSAIELLSRRTGPESYRVLTHRAIASLLRSMGQPQDDSGKLGRTGR
jgi:two-component system chemotaxis response regulator CheB